MITLSDMIKSGPMLRAQRIVQHGPAGVGKTTLASQYPEAIIVDPEEGSSHLAVNRILISDYRSLREALEAIRHTEIPCRTVVIDTIDRVELFLRDEVCKSLKISGIEAMAYGKAYQFLVEKFSSFIGQYLDPLISEGIHVVVNGHTNIKRVQFPGLESFDRWELRLHPGCANKLKEWADAVLFIHFKSRVIENEGKPRGVGGKERVIYTTHSAVHDAKVRIELPEELPCTFEAIEPLLCGWQRPPVVSLQEHFANALADLDPKQVIAFLIDRKQIRDDQAISDVGADYAREALRRLREFRKTISEFDFISM